MNRINVNDMRNTLLYRGVVGKMKKVADGAAAFRRAKDSLEKRGLGLGEAEKPVSELFYHLDKVAPEIYMGHFEKGTLGIISEAELVRRLYGIYAVAESARTAQELIPEVDKALEQKSATFATSVRSRRYNKDGNRWKRTLAVAKWVSAGVAVAGAALASYLQIRHGIDNATEIFGWAVSVATGGIASAALALRGQNSIAVPQAREPNPEVSTMRRVLAELGLSLNDLTKYSPLPAK